jgi:transcriptional regulator with XRE-family HTH domain
LRIGQRVRAARLEAGLTQEDLAVRAGVRLAVVGRLERGVVNDPHASTLTAIASALGVPVADLLEDQPELELELAGKGEAPQDRGFLEQVADRVAAQALEHHVVTAGAVGELRKLIVEEMRRGEPRPR